MSTISINHHEKLKYPYIYSEEFIANSPPMIQQYIKIKQAHLDKLVLFRLGDFYEFFYDDAYTVAKELNIAISNRNKNKEEPMAGFPFHAAEVYIIKLLKAGFSLVIAEQTGDAKGKGLTRREVVQILTPGTLTQEGFIDHYEQRPLVAIAHNLFSASLVILDLASGRFEYGEFHNHAEFIARLEQSNPAEILYFDDNNKINQYAHLNEVVFTPLSEKFFNSTAGQRKVKEFSLLGDSNNQHHSIKLDLTYQAINALFEYVKHTQNKYPLHTQQLQQIKAEKTMILDRITLSNLEILINNRGNKNSSLFSAINHCITSLGARQLQRDLLRPLLDPRQIEQRLNLIDSLLNHPARTALEPVLKAIGDIERIIARIGLTTATPADLTNLRNSLDMVDQLNQIIVQYNIDFQLFVLPQQPWQLLTSYLEEYPAKKIGDGRIFKRGINPQLDHLYEISLNAEQFITKLEEKERQNSGIESLKIENNHLNGYYIQVPLNSQVPTNYIHSKSLKNSIRYITSDLQQLTSDLINAQYQINSLENQLLTDLLVQLQQSLDQLQIFSYAVARLDVGFSQATLAYNYNYTRPVFNNHKQLQIIQGRHPVIEQIQQTPFIANDCQLGYCDDQKATDPALLQLITGPNMGGKSTFMRQTALICLLAQAGGYVPAQSANLPLIDRIFTRIGANDDLSQGKSTFMVEMEELSVILNHATENSLLIIDEIGRGTSTYDGLSIAWSTIEYISQKIKALTLCATHYFELTQLSLPNLVNVHLEAYYQLGKIRFAYQLKNGAANKSYGIAVAQLAGLPSPVVQLAQLHLQQLEQDNLADSTAMKKQQNLDLLQQFLHQSGNNLSTNQQEMINKLQQLDPDSLTPKLALDILYELVSLAKDNSYSDHR